MNNTGVKNLFVFAVCSICVAGGSWAQGVPQRSTRFKNKNPGSQVIQDYQATASARTPENSATSGGDQSPSRPYSVVSGYAAAASASSPLGNNDISAEALPRLPKRQPKKGQETAVIECSNESLNTPYGFGGLGGGGFGAGPMNGVKTITRAKLMVVGGQVLLRLTEENPTQASRGLPLITHGDTYGDDEKLEHFAQEIESQGNACSAQLKFSKARNSQRRSNGIASVNLALIPETIHTGEVSPGSVRAMLYIENKDSQVTNGPAGQALVCTLPLNNPTLLNDVLRQQKPQTSPGAKACDPKFSAPAKLEGVAELHNQELHNEDDKSSSDSANSG